MQAICLCAGLGKRLRPVTNHLPKPLFPVLGRPNLEHIIISLKAQGLSKIAVNCYHLAEKIKSFLTGNHPDCAISEEKELLGTGGGIKKAWGMLDSNAPVLVINGDVHTNFPLDRLMVHHLRSGAVATLLLTDRPPLNTVLVDKGQVLDFGKGNECEGRYLCFTGVSILSPRLLSYTMGQTRFSIVETFELAIRSGERIDCIIGEDHMKDFLWMDIGTPRGYLKLHEILLEGHIGNGEGCGEWVWVPEGMEVPRQILLRRCVVWPGVVLDCQKREYEDMVITPFGILNGRMV